MNINWSEPFKDPVPVQDYTHIVCVIDKSGSMSGKKSDVIGGFNKFLAEQKALPGEAYLTLIQFDHQYEVKLNRVDLSYVGELSKETYKPRGNTALLDAVGRAINGVPYTDKKVIVLVITDGEENSSTMYRKEAISNLVKLKTDAGWSFVYLGAGLTSFRDATSMGFHANNVVTWTNDSIGIGATYSTASMSASNYRTSGVNIMGAGELKAAYDANVKATTSA